MRIGIIGAGMIGSTLAKLWSEAGHEVRLASRHPEHLKDLVAHLGTLVSAGTPMDAAEFGDVVMLTVPLKAVPDLARDLRSSLTGKVVLDTGNAYERRDGEIACRASEHAAGSAGWAAAMFPEARWVKAFNTVYFKTLQSEARRSGARLGIPLAGDDPEALRIAADLVREAGFDPVIVGPLVRGKDFEPNSRPYNTGKSGSELRALFSQPT
jgi:8-hydroxy-5-deazaflavin:NADPH oxidoreductase